MSETEVRMPTIEQIDRKRAAGLAGRGSRSNQAIRDGLHDDLASVVCLAICREDERERAAKIVEEWAIYLGCTSREADDLVAEIRGLRAQPKPEAEE